MPEVMDGREPKLLMDIHSVSEVNRPEIDLSEIEGPAHSSDFKNDHFNFNQKGKSMIFYNKLFRIDMVLVIAVICLISVKPGKLE